MGEQAIKRALISVHDKTGVVEFARTLHEEFGIEIISTGGTASLLAQNGIPVTRVEEITGFGEMLGGRVKTLHPKIHAAILADRDNPDHMRQLADAGIEPIDLVVVNLYPFARTIARPGCTFDEAIEMIDIGGPSLLRAAAKNHKHVFVVSDPGLYDWARSALRKWDREETREAALRRGAESVFIATASYDGEIATWLNRDEETRDARFRQIVLRRRGSLRYGENPHQHSAVFQRLGERHSGVLSTLETDEDFGTHMSFNNFLDSDAAFRLCEDLTRERLLAGAGSGPSKQRSASVCVFIKHANPCGVGMAEDAVEAYRKAYLGDPNAAMGGVLAVNFPVDAAFAEAVMNSLQRWGKDAGAGAFFIEVWLAPAFEDDAVEIIRARKTWGAKMRRLDVGNMGATPDLDDLDLRPIAGGVLVQTRDLISLNEEKWYVPTDRKPTNQEMNDLRPAWLIAKHTKSNAISLVRDGQLIGNGAGQMSRVMSCRIATWLARENGHLTRDEATKGRSDGGIVAASDGFFPFRDGPDILIDAGVTAIIQPGGSKRDAETIAACNERGVAMVFTRTRHFKH